MWIRLRQIALVAEKLSTAVDDMRAVFGLEVAYNDPGVATFGLENALLPIGSQQLEIVAPTKEGTAGGRQLERRGGDGGYMVICHTDDHPPLRARVGELGIRTVLEYHDKHGGYTCMQLHPSDTGGSFLEIDHQKGGEDPMGPWEPAGPNWQQAIRTDVIRAIAAAEVQANDPARVAAKWSEITAIPLVQRDGVAVLPFENADVRFVPITDGRGEGLGGIDLVANDAERAFAAARARGLRVDGDVIHIVGMRCRLV